MRSIERLLSAVEVAAAGVDFPCEEVYLASPSFSASYAFDGCDDLEALLDDLRFASEVSPKPLELMAQDEQAWIEFTPAGDDIRAGDDTPEPLYEATTDGEQASAPNVLAGEPTGKVPRFWRLFGYILPRKTRQRVFEPAYQDLLEDYLTTRGKYRTKRAKRWLAGYSTFRPVLMVADCTRALRVDKALAFSARLVPEPAERWWLSK